MDEVIYELSMGGGEPIWFLIFSWVVLETFERRHILGKVWNTNDVCVFQGMEISFVFFASRCVYLLF
jgi:hypothetical protein